MNVFIIIFFFQKALDFMILFFGRAVLSNFSCTYKDENNVMA